MNEYVWITPQKGNPNLPIGAYILAVFDSRIKVKDDDNKEYWISPQEILRPMHPSSIHGVDDMITLDELKEYSILRNLQIRYMKDYIYTYVGSLLVAVNPYKLLPIYDKSKMIEYRKKRLGELPPHVFAVADHSYESMRKKLEKRCIIISGESGAGKTESTKFFLQYLARISPKKSRKEQQILDSNPILEVFGNAKTMRNDNSSRFGKYVEINFSGNGSVESAQIKHYLLEKSRIVSQSKNEQNYHIFYVILAGMTAEEKRGLGLRDASFYNYLNRAENTSETNETNDIGCIKSAMKVLNFSDTEIWSIFELVAAILHFGNVQYEASSVGNVEAVEIINEKEVENICKLLQVSKQRLGDSLTKNTISTLGDNVVKFLSKQQAIDSRDAFVKRIYGNLFTFIVDKINETLFEDKKTSNGYIGILDIFGFEAFDKNSFEQLCINYANEKLQQFFVKHTFKSEQEQYAIEGIDWKYIEYTDNRDILDLIEIGPSSILSVINDESKFPQGNHRMMLDKLIKFHSDNNIFFKPKFKDTEVFGVKHFAGVVLYDVQNFLEKNHDTFNLDMKQIVHLSTNDFLKKIFANDFEMDLQSNHKKRTETLASKFKSSLDTLMDELKQCEPFFVRCIKPNEDKKPKKFDRMLCWKQLRYSGMTETTKVREAGYPLRYDYVQFVQRYRVLCPGTPLAHKISCKETTKKICRIVFRNFPKADFQLGRTKIFLKYREESFLEQERNNALYAHVVIIQKICKGWLERRRFKKLKKAVSMVESCWIERQNRLQGKKMRMGFYRLQSKLRSRILNVQFHYLRHWISRFQAHCRGYLIRNFVRVKLEQLGSKNKINFLTEEDSSFTFQKYAEMYFNKKMDHRFSKKPIKTSLTCLVHPDDITAAKALWLTILRYTENIKEPQKNETKIPVKAQLREILGRINKNRKTLSVLPENTDRLYENWLKTQANNIDKLHFIVSHGIARVELRDEIYSQICKIITKNPSHKGTALGWDVLSACVGCFPPSDLFLKYLKTFIREGPKKHVSYCSFRLHRTFQNGSRTQPPCHTELQAIKQQKPIELEVFLMNDTSVFLKIDSAITAREMLRTVAKNINLTDTFGFSIFIVNESKHSSIGDGSNFVLDAVAQCEQYAMEIGHISENAPWTLFLKKEMFAPWHDYSADEVSSTLICHQISHGIKTGEYVCDAEDLRSIIADICYAERGCLKPPLLGQVIDQCLPHYILNSSKHELTFFKEQVEMIYRKKFEKNQRAINSVRRDTIEYAMKNLFLHFSKFFHLLGSVRNLKSSLSYPHTPLIIAVHSSGIMVIDESNEKRLIAGLEFMEIREIIRKETVEGQGYTLHIITYGGIEISLILRSIFDSDFHELLVRIVDTLKKYSKYAICVKDYKPIDKSFLEMHKGDLIKFHENFSGRDLLRNSCANGSNIRTGKTGKLLHDYVEIIPTMKNPSQSILDEIRNAGSSKTNQCYAHTERLKHYTLESYAEKHFTKQKSVGFRNEELWRYSSEKIQQPLHSNLAEDEKLSAEALKAFEAILHYMERQPGKLTNDESTAEKILSPGLQNDALKDELYCAIMKQLTSNTNRKSEDRCWELMWLMTGLFPCTKNLAGEVKKFLQSRRTMQTARECLTRFHKTLRSDSRKHPPHLIEIEAVQRRPCKILFKIYFPDDTHKFFQINSQTKVRDLIQDILNRLNLKTYQGFQLYVQIVKRFFLIPEDYYIFDYFQHLKKWIEKNSLTNVNSKYQIYFMKNHWKYITPGHDKLIDLKFLYPQEYNKYIQGYHKIPSQDIIYVASLLYGIHLSKERTQQGQQCLHELIPSSIIHHKKPEIWQKDIQLFYSKQTPIPEEDAKIEFLNYIYKLPSYGLQYFTATLVKSNQPDFILYPITMSSR